MDVRLLCKASMPLIQVDTRDPVNIHRVLEHYVPEALVAPEDGIGVEAGEVYLVQHTVEDYSYLYYLYEEAGATAILIDAEEVEVLALQVGEVLPPKDMVYELLNDLAVTVTDSIYQALSNLVLREIQEIVKIIQAKGEVVTPQTIASMLPMYQSSLVGLELLSTDNIGMYIPNEPIKDWLKYEAPFINSVDLSMVPKGLMFAGMGGLGKTLGAKYLAKQMNIPVYKLDAESMLNKYVGVSETNFRNALDRADTFQPCVLLIDEIDKLFVDTEDGVSSRLLSLLLWWLQERTSRIVVIMTCNELDKIPPHLYREGRIDQVISFMPWTDVVKIKRHIMEILKGIHHPSTNDRLGAKDRGILSKRVQKRLRDGMGSDWEVTPARLNSMVYAETKKYWVENG